MKTLTKIAAMIMISGMLLTPCFGSDLVSSGGNTISYNIPTTNTEPKQSYDSEFENFDQKSNQLFNIMSTVLKGIKEMGSAVSRNML